MIDLDKILELEANASSAPWQCFEDMEPGLKLDWTRGYMTERDIDFVSIMRNNIRQICEELKAAREAIELLENIEEFAWDVDREKAQEVLYKYHEVTNEK